MKLFRKFRFKNLVMKNFKKYILYAIGEIFLIVIGVLIAISVNNSNADRKMEKQLYSIIQKVKVNLKNDISSLDTLILDYESLDTVIQEIINGKYPVSHLDTINISNYDNCVSCYAYHISLNPFHPKLDGYEQLKSLPLDWNTNESMQTQNILIFYQEHLRGLKAVEQSIMEEILNNLKSIEEYDWYTDYLINKYNPASIRYFHTDKMYKNKLATYQLLTIGNYLDMLKKYRKKAITLSKSLNTE